MVRLSVLGPIVVVDDDGTPRALGGPQQQRLLAALAVQCPLPVSKDTLEDLLWPDGPPSANALQAQVSKLRKSLTPVDVVGSSAGYALAIERDTMDSEAFERHVTTGRDSAAAGDHTRAASCFRSALALWRGVPYGEIADHFVGQAASARLTSLRDAARAGRIEADLAVGQLDQAAAELDALVAAEPLMERWWALLMLARYRQHRQADALRAFADARRVLAGELGLEPGPELREMERRVLAHDPSLQQSALTGRASRARADARSSRLPQRVSSFVGRREEIETLHALLAESRLVTVVGAGGSGKTTLATEVARRIAEQPADASGPPGVRSVEAQFIELAPLVTAGDVIAAFAAALGVPRVDRAAVADHGSDAERIADIVGEREVLLVVDNCEHVVDDVAGIVHTLLSRCGGLRVVATSRESLDVPGEVTWPIPPMRADDGAELFEARARAGGGVTSVPAGERTLVDRLVAELDGLPLAIELAAARLRTLGIAELLERLGDRFAVLTSGPRTATPRQQTLRGVVDWSHDLLDAQERVVFRRLGAFVGGASLSAAIAVCACDDTDPTGAAPVDAATVEAVIERLVHKSLVVAEHTAHGVRFRMLQTLLHYAVERLVESGENEAVRLRHARHFAALVAPVERGLMGHGQARFLALVTYERDNIGTALDHATALGEADLAIALVAPLGWYFFMVAEVPLGVEWMHQALSCPGPTDPRRRALTLGLFAWLAVTSNEVGLAAAAAGDALEMLASFEDPWTECLVACTAVMTYLYLGQVEECLAVLPLARSAAERSGERWCQAIATVIDAEIAMQIGDVGEAERNYTVAIDAIAAAGDQFMRALTVTQAAELAEARGEYDRAIRSLEEAVLTAEAVGFSSASFAIHARIANLEALRGNLALAAEQHQSVLADATAGQSPWLRAMALVGLAMIARRRDDPDTAIAMLREAWAMPRTHAVPVMRTMVASALGYSEDQRGDAVAALQFQRQSLAVSLELGGTRIVANAVEGMAGALALAGASEDAARLLGRADALRRSVVGPQPAAERFDVDRAERRSRGAIGDAAFDVAFASGAASDTASLVVGLLDGDLAAR